MLKNKEIAEILKISPAAVSLALNNKHGVSEETRRRVIALRNGSVAAEFNSFQQQNLHASQLLFIVLKKHGNVICDTPFFMTLSETLHQQTSIEGYGLQVSYFEPKDDVEKYLHSLNVDRYDGILVLGTEAKSEDIGIILSLGRPTIVLDAWFDDQKVDCVLMDNENGVKQAMRYAGAQGHRKIGFIGSYVQANNFRDRYRAYRASLNELDIPFDERYVHFIHSTVDGASRDMQRILQNHPELPTLFFCANDLLAMGVMDALNRSGYMVPGDVSVIGFDDMPVSAHVNPPLTTVGFHTRKMARTAVKILVDRLRENNGEDGCMRCMVNADLKIRKSVSNLVQN